MFPFGPSLFEAGLIITVVVLVVLYLAVLIKLNPSTEGERILKKGLSKQRILKKNLTEQQVKPAMFNEVEEETVESIERQEPVSPAPVETEVEEETVESIERQEPVSPAPVETEKTGVHDCPYSFGFLAEHPKNTPIPNECLTCTKIMECLSKGE